MKEVDLKLNVEKYLGMLDQQQRESFAPIDILLKNCMDGTDTHVLAFKNINQIQTTNVNMIQGLLIFNTDANSFKV